MRIQLPREWGKSACSPVHPSHLPVETIASSPDARNSKCHNLFSLKIQFKMGTEEGGGRAGKERG